MGKPHLVYFDETAKGLARPHVFTMETYQNGRRVCTMQERDEHIAKALRWCRKNIGRKGGRGIEAVAPFEFGEDFESFEFRDENDAALFRMFWG